MKFETHHKGWIYQGPDKPLNTTIKIQPVPKAKVTNPEFGILKSNSMFLGFKQAAKEGTTFISIGWNDFDAGKDYSVKSYGRERTSWIAKKEVQPSKLISRAGEFLSDFTKIVQKAGNSPNSPDVVEYEYIEVEVDENGNELSRKLDHKKRKLVDAQVFFLNHFGGKWCFRRKNWVYRLKRKWFIWIMVWFSLYQST